MNRFDIKVLFDPEFTGISRKYRGAPVQLDKWRDFWYVVVDLLVDGGIVRGNITSGEKLASYVHERMLSTLGYETGEDEARRLWHLLRTEHPAVIKAEAASDGLPDRVTAAGGY